MVLRAVLVVCLLLADAVDVSLVKSKSGSALPRFQCQVGNDPDAKDYSSANSRP
jgi:hypothetical protein